jgi:hypothetical protein
MTSTLTCPCGAIRTSPITTPCTCQRDAVRTSTTGTFLLAVRPPDDARRVIVLNPDATAHPPSDGLPY